MKLVLATLATIALAAPALAGTSDNPLAQEQAVLTLKDLDLATADGQQRLAIRMDRAARTVCGEGLDRVHLAAEAKAEQCRTAVIADVRAQIESRVAATQSPVRLASLR